MKKQSLFRMGFLILSLWVFSSRAQTLVNQTATNYGSTLDRQYNYFKALPLPSSYGGGQVYIQDNYSVANGSSETLTTADSTNTVINSVDLAPLNGSGSVATAITRGKSFVYVAGVTLNANGTNTSSYHLIQLDVNTLDTIWTVSIPDSSKYPVALLPDNDSGYVYIALSEKASSTRADISIIKYNRHGTRVFESKFDSAGYYNVPVAMSFADPTNIIITGFNFDNTGKSNFITFKMKIDGFVGPVTFSSNGTGAIGRTTNVYADSIGNAYVGGTSTINGLASVIKVVSYFGLDTSIHLQWVSTYGDTTKTNTLAAFCLDGQANQAQNMLLAGTIIDGSGNHSIIVLKYGIDGTLKWSKTIAAANPAYPSDAVDITYDAYGTGNIYVTGTQYNGSDLDLLTFALDSSSNILWQKTYGRGLGTNETPYNILFNEDGTISVTAKSFGTDSQYVMLEYDQWQATCQYDLCPTITYSIKNAQVTTSGVDSFAEFDIYAAQSIAGIPYYNGYIALTYSNSIFGPNAVDSGRISISRGAITSDSNYTLVVVDTLFKSDAVPANCGEIWLSVSRSNATGLYNVADTLQQLCHVKMKMKNSSRGNCQIGFDQYFMEPLSYFYNDAITPYKFVATYGRVGSLRSGNIDVQIANASYTSSLLTFELQVQSASGDYFHNATIDVSYNTDNFGTNVAPSNLQCTSPLTNYDLGSPTNVSSNEFEIEIAGNYSIQGDYIAYGASLPSLPYSTISTYTTIATCSLSVQNCCYIAGSGDYLTISSVSADFSTLSVNDGGDPTDSSDNWSIEQNDNSLYGRGTWSSYTNSGVGFCSGGSTPSITGLNPLNISSGTYSVLTISGSGFGCDTGQVWFPNANDGGVTMLHTLRPDIQSWSDNEIKVWVPSIQNPATDSFTSGSGYIQVMTSTGTMSGPSTDYLTIPYALRNARSTVGKAYPVLLPNQNSSGGITFTPASYITGDTLTAITKALNDWACQIGVPLTIGSPTSTPSINSTDNINTILFGSLPSGTDIRTIVMSAQSSSSCAISPAAIIGDVDIIINTNSIFYLSTNDAVLVPTGQHSLMGEMRHEFGHSFGLKHVLEHSLMYWLDAGGGNYPSQIQSPDKDGALYQLGAGPTYLNSGCYGLQIYPSGCSGPHLSIIDIGSNPFDISAFPNPFDQKITIHADLKGNGEVKVAIFDIVGQIVSSVSLGQRSGLVYEPIDVSKLSDGVYVIQISVDNYTTQMKMVKNKNQ